MVQQQSNTKLNIVLWVLQVLLAAVYLMAGMQKGFGDLAEVVKTIFWIGYTPALLVRFIGISELLAAAGLSTIMLLANLMHIYRGEYFVLPFTVTMFVLAAFVAYGRWKLVPLTAKP